MDKTSKRFAVAGGFISNGAFIPHAHHNMARAGAPKRLDPVLTVPGQKRQTKPSDDFRHGSPVVQDEPLQRSWEGRQVPVHPSMKSREQRGAIADGFDTLRKASDQQCFDNADDQCKQLPSAMKR